ncbi:hypothetical protein Ddye_004718, partial [Dipteronia dyeriana]
SDYEKEPEDFAAGTCVHLTKYWDTLQALNIPREECAYGSDIDDGSNELKILEGLYGEEVERGPVRKFINRSYHEFNPNGNLQDPTFIVGIEFGSVEIFRVVVRAHAVKQTRNDKFSESDPNKYYRARNVARHMIKCVVEEQYSKLWEYDVNLKRMNPDSSVIFKFSQQQCDENPRQLLTAIRVTPNNQMYLVAYALVESNYKDTWTWFLEQLAVDLGINNSFGVVCISDKQKGLLDAIGDLFPNSEHRLCVKHFYNNFKV